MKVLTVDFYFKLPDDFEGGFTEALQELVKYDKEKGKHKRIWGKAKDVEGADMWKRFLESLKEGYKLSGKASVDDYVDGEWVRLEPKKEQEEE